MSFFSRLLAARADPREQLRPLWHRVVEIARQPHWYAREGVADTVPGRFDVIVAVLALVLLRMERDPAMAGSAALLTELFVEDMDGQLRESGVGDLMVGKHMGRLMSVLGGRLGTLRRGLGDSSDTDGQADHLVGAVERNFTLANRTDPAPLAAALRDLHHALAAIPEADLLAGRIPA